MCTRQLAYNRTQLEVLKVFIGTINQLLLGPICEILAKFRLLHALQAMLYYFLQQFMSNIIALYPCDKIAVKKL